MRKNFAACALFLTALASCKKTDSANPSSNTWKISTESYSAAAVRAYSSAGQWSLMAVSDTSASPASGISFGFNAMPAVSGSYKIVSALTGNGTEITFSVFRPGANAPDFYTGANGSASAATVTVAGGGKVSVSLTNVTAVAAGGASGTLPVSANAITEP